MDINLTAAEQGEMKAILGPKRANAILEAANKLKSPPKGELTKRQDPKVDGKGKYYTEVEDPRKGQLKRLDPMTLERLALDPQVGAALEIIKLPILTIRPEILHPEREVKEFLQYELERVWLRLAREMLTALEFGFVVFEKVWTYRDTTVERDGNVLWQGRAAVYDKIKSLHPSAVQLLIGEQGEDLGFEQIAGGTAKVPPEKVLRYTHAERFGNPYGNPRTRRAYKPWWWSELIYQFANRYFEDQSIPQRKVYYEPDPQPVDPANPDGPSKDQALEAALKVAEDSRSGAAVAFPLQEMVGVDGSSQYSRGWDMEYLLGQNKQTEFTAYLDHLDLKKMRGMFVPEKLTNQSGPGAAGSYAMVESLSDFFLLGEEALVGDLLDTLARAWARPLIDFNFGTSLPDALFAPAKLSQNNRAFLQDFFKTLMASLLANPYGVGRPPDIDLEAYAEELGVPLRKPEDDGVTEQSQGDPDTAPAPTPERPMLNSRRTFEVPGERDGQGDWERATAKFQELLGKTYKGWARETAAQLSETPAEQHAAVLDERLAELERNLLAQYRAGALEAQGLGYGKSPTPAALQKLATRMRELEQKVHAEVIPKVRERILSDLQDLSGKELQSAIELRMGLVTNPAGGDYWGTIFEGWADARREREKDPGVKVGRVRWVLDPMVQHHCEDCPSRAGTYDSIDELPSIPGDGRTACGNYCRCWLEEEDPETGNWRRRITDL